ncbi:MAG: hypothetical protein U9Q80_07615 [Bacillota bacterium]|nr:hypothetical protein [Bacillota bacterium]
MHREGNQLNIDIKNVYFDKKQFNAILGSTLVENIEFDEYMNIDNTTHKIMKLWLDKKIMNTHVNSYLVRMDSEIYRFHKMNTNNGHECVKQY